MIRLSYKMQHYMWGKRGEESIVGQLCSQTVEEDEYYAELWMGTHPNGPTELADQKQTPLKDYLKEHAYMLGEHEGGDLQFLFKVLSVGKPLSLQSHPTKEQAKALHAKDPKNYPDDNHKPEMAIALTDFEMLCGFQKCHNILSNIKAHKELLELIGGEEALTELADEGPGKEKKQQAALKKIFTQVWSSTEETVQGVLQEILARIFQKDDKSPVDDLVLRLGEQFPGDIGALAPFFFNHFTLKPGEATFLGPNEPHAYLFGDCIECMALSDNTIRAGLTPKFKDVSTLCESLTYRMYDPPIFQPMALPEGAQEYAPPVEEFAVHKIGKNVATLQSIGAGSIFIVVEGEGSLISLVDGSHLESIKKGDVLFLPRDFKCALGDDCKNCDNFLAFRAFNPPNK